VCLFNFRSGLGEDNEVIGISDKDILPPCALAST
jgi:hypothetical protein